MPRQKPSFTDYSYLFENLEIVIPDSYVKNSYITIKCKNNSLHSYKVNVPEVLKGKDPKECPHCRLEKRYEEKGVSINFFDDFIEKNNLEIVNRKDYYNRWEDSIIFRCGICKVYEIEIKSIGYFEKHINDKKYFCEKCSDIEKGLLNLEEFNKRIELIKYKEKIKSELLVPINYDVIPEGLKNKIISQDKWIVVYFENANKKAKYQCKDCGYIKEVGPYSLFIGRGFGCLECDRQKRRKEVIENIKQACINSNCYPIRENDFYINPFLPIEFKCNICGEIFNYPWSYVNGNARNGKELKIICQHCHRSTKRASENDLALFISTIYNDKIERTNRTIIAPFELDIFLPNIQVAFEYCGGIWHSTKFDKDINKQKNKYELCKEKGIRLITIFEDEWLDNRAICESRIKTILGKNKIKVFARKCLVKNIENNLALVFCDKNHIQGRGHAMESYGLFYNNDLVSVMTFSKPSIVKNASRYDWELNRFCSKMDTIVIGGASKLLSKFLETHKGEKLVTFCDLRWGTGNVYEKMGFEMINKTRPNYYYIGASTKWKRKHRFNFTKQRLIKLFNENDTTLTEEEIAKKNGLYRIFDCGHLKFQMG